MTAPRPPAGTLAGRILAALPPSGNGATGGTTDAELARALGVRAQAVNTACRVLAARGLIARVRQQGTLVNLALPPPEPAVARRGERVSVERHPWFWEGNVQRTAAASLRERGWDIVGEADTASREPGTDIVATRASKTLWVTVKGYPERSGRTHPATQARHWYAAAIFDIVRYREAKPDIVLAVALPDFPTYRSLARQTAWLETAAPFAFIWIAADGSATNDLPDD